MVLVMVMIIRLLKSVQERKVVLMAVNNRFIIDKDGDVLDNCSNKKFVSLDDIVSILNRLNIKIEKLQSDIVVKICLNDTLEDKVKSASMLCSALADIINAYYDFLDKNFPNLTKEDMVDIVFKVIKSDIDWFLFCNGIKNSPFGLLIDFIVF